MDVPIDVNVRTTTTASAIETLNVHSIDSNVLKNVDVLIIVTAHGVSYNAFVMNTANVSNHRQYVQLHQRIVQHSVDVRKDAFAMEISARVILKMHVQKNNFEFKSVFKIVT